MMARAVPIRTVAVKKLKLSSEPFEFKLSSLTPGDTFLLFKYLCLPKKYSSGRGGQTKDVKVFVDFLP